MGIPTLGLWPQAVCPYCGTVDMSLQVLGNTPIALRLLWLPLAPQHSQKLWMRGAYTHTLRHIPSMLIMRDDLEESNVSTVRQKQDFQK